MHVFVMFVLFMLVMRRFFRPRHHRPMRRLHHGAGRFHPVANPHVPLPAGEEKPEASAFERLKQRYVEGELSVEQYEAELDALIKSGDERLT